MYMIFSRNKLRDRLDDSTLRLLTETEIEWVAGGSGSYGSGTGGYGDEIVVVGKRYRKNPIHNYWFLVDTGDTGSGYDDHNDIPGYGYGNPPPPPPPPPPPEPTLSDAARNFADAHVKFNGSSQDVDEFHQVKEGVAKFYDWATANPTSRIDIGHGVSITASQALSVWSNISIDINNNTSRYGQAAAYAPENATRNGVDIQINPQSTAYGYYSLHGTSGLDYLIFHEVGHALNYFYNRDVYNQQGSVNEGAADAAAHSLQQQIGIPEMQR